MAIEPVQSASLGVAEASQESAFVLDHVSVTEWPKLTESDEAEIVTEG
ncbi:MAG TPA: hypothetical protein VLX32_06940 [Candidatus Acidoferrum sp.]|nr:hypothetical protein [Candidatus Acidoferrum sp.]